MKLTTTTFVSVDGVMQGIGGPDEDRSGGFERGGWTVPHFDNETATFVNQVYRRADAFLLGRRTYEIFTGSWGAMADPGRQPQRSDLEHAAQVRGIDHTHRPAVGEHDRPLRLVPGS
jgi:dihydrofolate reductase